MKIDRIYIACFKYDLRFTRILVASIRQFYPEIPIELIKDEFYGAFDTSEIEHHWNVSVLSLERNAFSWGFSKLEALFLPEPHRFLVLDSDTVFTGPLLKLLEPYDDDFIVPYEDPTPAFVKSHYFDLDGLKEVDPSFSFPGYTFNTGQWVGNTGKFKRKDLAHLLDWKSPPALKYPNVFKLGEQGLMNYFLMAQAAAGKISIRRSDFMEVGKNPAVMQLQLKDLGDRERPFMIHWCGLKKKKISVMPRGDLLLHFERLYYSRIPGGIWRGHLRNLRDYLADVVRTQLQKRGLRMKHLKNIRALPYELARKKIQAASANGIVSGPFRRMKYIDQSVCSALSPKLLGCYELELHAIVEQLLAREFKTVIDVGAAEGYYAVGWLVRDPKVKVIAFEADEAGREQMSRLAARNGMQARLQIKGFCGESSLEETLAASEKPLLIMDVEGAEDTLLDPARIPALRQTTILVELHEFVKRGIGADINRRFSKTHRVSQISSRERVINDSPIRSLFLDRWIARHLREGRPEIMQWFLMEPNLSDAPLSSRPV